MKKRKRQQINFKLMMLYSCKEKDQAKQKSGAKFIHSVKFTAHLLLLLLKTHPCCGVVFYESLSLIYYVFEEALMVSAFLMLCLCIYIICYARR